MTVLDTPRGPVDSSKLGKTLMHEHIFVFDQEVAHNLPKTWNEDERHAVAVERLQNLKSRGIDTIVDLTVLGLGRSLPRVQRVADEVDLNIILATGLYEYSDPPVYFRTRTPELFGGTDPLLEYFVSEIRDGIADTGLKAGILKCCTDEPGVTPGIDRILRCVAQAHRATGVPISTHTNAGMRRGLDQQEVFRSEGVDLTRVIIGHSGDSADIDYLEELMKNGSYLGMDRFGMDPILSFEQRCATVATLVERGWVDQIVLSHDTACASNWIPPEMLATMPNWKLTHISDDVLPKLRSLGVTDEQIDVMLVDNPRRIFEVDSPY
jgi:phosphotriesterase-related protein